MSDIHTKFSIGDEVWCCGSYNDRTITPKYRACSWIIDTIELRSGHDPHVLYLRPAPCFHIHCMEEENIFATEEECQQECDRLNAQEPVNEDIRWEMELIRRLSDRQYATHVALRWLYAKGLRLRYRDGDYAIEVNPTPEKPKYAEMNFLTQILDHSRRWKREKETGKRNNE